MSPGAAARPRTVRAAAAMVALLWCGAAQGQSLPSRVLGLAAIPGVAGHEAAVRDAVRAGLPAWATPRVDEIGNLIVTLGSGRPHVALVADLDERGYVVSRITDEGFLRLHRHTRSPGYALADQYSVGQPVFVRTSNGTLVQGMTATPSTHLSRLVDPAEVARVKGVGDLWVDVGASSAADVRRLGIRLLDSVSLRERAQPLADGRIAGVAARARAGAAALVALLQGYSTPPAVTGTLTVAWLTESQYGSRGLARLAQEIHPDRAYIVDPIDLPRPPAGWEKTAIESTAVPAQFAGTPVEVVDTHDIPALVTRLAGDAGLPPPAHLDGASAGAPAAAQPPASASAPALPPSFALLKTLIETYGVSGHEAPVREQVLTHLPSWAAPQTDGNGNVTVSFGTGGRTLLFVAHLDEVGFELSAIRDDGTADVRPRGGMYLSLYEAHPVLVETPTGRVPAIMAPRRGYATASTAQPAADALYVYFGTSSAAGTRALGVAEGQPVTVRKQFVELAPPRAAGRSMDDRAGSTALLLALQRIDPAAVRNRVTFAWDVEEETGLYGARALAGRLHPEYAFAVDTFVSTDAPLDVQYLAHAPLGAGAVLRGMDSRSVVPPATIDRIVALAEAAGVPLQIGVTQGGTDASAFAAGGAIDVGLSWPGRYSHSPVEVVDRRDLEALVHLIAALAQAF